MAAVVRTNMEARGACKLEVGCGSQDSTAQHSTAQRSTAQHSAAQRRTAPGASTIAKDLSS